MRVLVAGATGLVGRALLQRLAGGTPMGRVTALVPHAAQATALPAGVRSAVVDFKTLGQAGQPGLPATDWALCCLGTTIKVAGSQAAFRAVDFDAVLAFARAAKVAGVNRLGVVSALGADARSAVFYNRVKGEMEQALRALGLPQLVLARPSLLLGDRSALGQAPRLMETLAQAWMPAVGWLIPRALRPISADAVAAALIAALATDKPGVQVIESAALQALADSSAAG